MYSYRNKYGMIVLGALFLFIAIFRIIFPDLDHGDEFTDANVLNAGENFVKLGFIKCRFLPIFEPNLDKPSNAYTHVPPLPDIINGLLRVIFRTNSLRFFRSVSLFFSLLSLIFWYLFIKRFTNSYIISFLAAIFYLTNPLFIYGMDSLHESSYSEFLRSLIFFIFMIMLNIPKKRKTILFFLWVLVVLESLVTYEYVIYLSLFFMFFRVFYKDSKIILSKKVIFILLLAPAFGFLLHFLQNVWYFGNFSLAFQDLKNIAIQRMFYSRDAPSLSFVIWWQYVILRNFSLVFSFNYSVLFLSVFFSYLLYQTLPPKIKEEVKSLFKLFLLFGICGISWYIIFPSHSWAHTFVFFLARHLLPFAFIGLTLFFYIILSFYKESIPYNLYLRALWAIMIIVIVFTGIRRSELPVTYENIKRSQDFITFKKCLLRLKEVSREKDEVGVNYFRFPFIRYYTNRHCLAIFEKSSLENFSTLPKYFIFIPYDNQVAQELFEFLNQRYLSIFKCDSLRFPATFFELKN